MFRAAAGTVFCLKSSLPVLSVHPPSSLKAARLFFNAVLVANEMMKTSNIALRLIYWKKRRVKPELLPTPFKIKRNKV